MTFKILSIHFPFYGTGEAGIFSHMCVQGKVSLGGVLEAELHLGSWKHSSRASDKVFDVVLVLKKSSTLLS